MLHRFNLPHWFRLPSGLALLLGIGSMPNAAAQADIPSGDQPLRVPQQSVKSLGELRVWAEDGRVFVSEGGGEPRELLLGDTAEARHLRQLLREGGAVPASPQIVENRIILVGGGGDGFHWAPADRSRQTQPPAGDVAGAGPPAHEPAETTPTRTRPQKPVRPTGDGQRS